MSTIQITDIQLFNLLKNKLGEKEAEAVTNYVKQEVEAVTTYVKQEVEESNKKVIQFFNKDFESLREHIDYKFQNLDEKFKTIDEKFKTQDQTMSFKIEQLRSDNYKVTFWSSLIQILTIIGAIIALYKILKP